MCIIIVVPKGEKLPSIDTIKECWYRNPDGAGYCYLSGGLVAGRKGFMNFDKFMNSVTNNVTSGPAILHFRIATTGSVVPGNTHPFPVSKMVTDLKALRWKSQIGVAHNGVIHRYAVKNAYDLSDTQLFIKGFLSKPRIYKRLRFKGTQKEVYREAGSKLAILDSSGVIRLFGDFIQDKGLYYSNSSYKPYKKEKWVWELYDKKNAEKDLDDVPYLWDVYPRPSVCEYRDRECYECDYLDYNYGKATCLLDDNEEERFELL